MQSAATHLLAIALIAFGLAGCASAEQQPEAGVVVEPSSPVDVGDAAEPGAAPESSAAPQSASGQLTWRQAYEQDLPEPDFGRVEGSAAYVALARARGYGRYGLEVDDFSYEALIGQGVGSCVAADAPLDAGLSNIAESPPGAVLTPDFTLWMLTRQIADAVEALCPELQGKLDEADRGGPGATCADVSTNGAGVTVFVTRGEVTCPAATELTETYFSPDTEREGSGAFWESSDGWSCSAPDAEREATADVVMLCERSNEVVEGHLTA